MGGMDGGKPVPWNHPVLLLAWAMLAGPIMIGFGVIVIGIC